jgi:hypothetical protein
LLLKAAVFAIAAARTSKALPIILTPFSFFYSIAFFHSFFQHFQKIKAANGSYE